MLTKESIRKWPHLPSYRHYRELWSVACGPMRKALVSSSEREIVHELLEDGSIIEVIYDGHPCLALSSLGRIILDSDVARRWKVVERREDKQRRAEMKRHEYRAPPLRQRMANYRWVKQWDRTERAKNPLAGLRGPSITNSKWSVNLASRHWPHRLCWDWLISANYNRIGWDRRVIGWYGHRGQCGVMLYFITLRICWQDNWWMSACGRTDAPKPIWTHAIKEPVRVVPDSASPSVH